MRTSSFARTCSAAASADCARRAGTSSTNKRTCTAPSPSLTALRKQLITLRRGSQVLHRISGDGVNFGHPRRIGGERMRSLVCWSRLFLDQETLVVFNTDESNAVAAWSTVAPMLRVEGDQFRLIFWHAPKPAASHRRRR